MLILLGNIRNESGHKSRFSFRKDLCSLNFELSGFLGSTVACL